MQLFFHTVFLLPVFVFMNRSRKDMCEIVKKEKISEQTITFLLFWIFVSIFLKMSGVHFLSVAADALMSVAITACVGISVAIANGLLEYRKQRLEN
jgi:hypothetical protein